MATNGLGRIDKDFHGKANNVVLSMAGYWTTRLAAVKAYVAQHSGITIVAQTGTVSGNSSLDANHAKRVTTAHPLDR